MKNASKKAEGTKSETSGRVMTQAELARRMGLSRVTVNRALAHHPAVAEETRQKVLSAMRDSGYQPDATARAMRSQRKRQIGVLLANTPDRQFHNMATFEMILGINDRLEAEGYVLSLIRLRDVQHAGDHETRIFQERLLDGVIVVDALPPYIYQKVEKYFASCTVWLEANVWREHNCIRRDEPAAGRLVVRKLSELGYRKLLWFSGLPVSEYHFSSAERYQAAEAEAGRLGIGFQALPFGQEQLRMGSYLEKQLPRVLTAETAVVAYNMESALAFQHAMLHLSAIAGRDYALASCDSSAKLEELWGDLSRVSNDRYHMGYEAAGMMLEKVEQEQAAIASRRFPGQWIPGVTARRCAPRKGKGV